MRRSQNAPEPTTFGCRRHTLPEQSPSELLDKDLRAVYDCQNLASPATNQRRANSSQRLIGDGPHARRTLAGSAARDHCTAVGDFCRCG